jgi:hypothetical protein
LTDAQFGIIPKLVRLATYQIWILPSSRRFGFLHLTIHVKYVRRQMMLIKCFFAITIMVDTTYFASSRSSFKFSSAFGSVHHVLPQHFDFYSDHATFFPAQVWEGIHENFISASSCALYICICISFWLISFYLWLVLIFLFSRVYYRFTPLWHRTSWHYTSWQICFYLGKHVCKVFE